MFFVSTGSIAIWVIIALIVLVIFVAYITAKIFKRIVSMLLTTLTIVVGGFGAYKLLNNKTKTPPTITATQQLPADIEFTVYANDNYSEVVIELNLIDKNDTVFKSTTLTGHNYIKDHTYSLKYSLSLSESLVTEYYNYKLLSY